MDKVYIVQDDGSKDLSPVLSIANVDNIVTVCGRSYPLFKGAEQAPYIKKRMRGFKENDYLLLIGDPINIALVFHYAFEQVNNVKVLKWDRHTESYFSITINKN